LCAAILRFYQFETAPFTHDELSALLRTNFSNFQELIAKGVAIDGHPAFIQVFLYYWTKLVGYEEWLVKLPFVISGLAAVYLCYKIGNRWYNETVGVIVATIVATSEYTVMYSLIARPYTTGLFFSLLLLYYWGEIVFFHTRAWKYYVGAAIAAALCAYNHHFGMLTATLIGIAGLFLIKKSQLVQYLVFGGAALLLYLPHLSILLGQLKIGGVEGWLGKPDHTFFQAYANYILHFSWITKVVLIVVIGLGIVQLKSNQKHPVKPTIIAGILFFAVFFIGYFYSIYGTAVLQYSVLIVVFPLLLFFVFGWIKACSVKTNWLISLLIGASFSFTLIKERQFYTVFYVPTFKQLVVDATKATQTNPKTAVLLFTDEAKTRFYSNEISIPKQTVFITIERWDENRFARFVKMLSHKYNQLYFGATSNVPPTFYPIIQQFFPYTKSTNNYYAASSVVFTKNKHDSKGEVIYAVKNVSMKSGEEWGPGLNRELAKLNLAKTDFIDLYASIQLADKNQVAGLVNALIAEDSLRYYSARLSNQFEAKDSVITMIQSLKLSDIALNKINKPIFNGYIWNISKAPLRIERFTIVKRKGNPYIYSLFEPIIAD
jgi:hypothetical protein